MGLLEKLMTRGSVCAAESANGRMRRIAIETPRLTWEPGQQVKVFVGGAVLGPRRTYTVWDHDGSTLELRVFLHGADGPGERWARRAAPGDEVLFQRPEGSFTVHEGAPYHLFAGDETASVAFGPMARSVPSARVYGVVEVDTPAERLPLPEGVTYVYREGASAAASESLVEGVRRLALPDEPGIAYVAGEARTVQAVRRHLVTERGWPRRSVRTKPFWAPGRKGLD